MKVRRSTTFDAVQWHESAATEFVESIGAQFFVRVYYGGLRALNVGDWILTWPNGDRFVINNDAFEQIYEPATNPGISADWVLNQLAGMTFPEQGGAYDFIKRCLEKS